MLNVHFFTIAPIFSLGKSPVVYELFFPEYACFFHIELIL